MISSGVAQKDLRDELLSLARLPRIVSQAQGWKIERCNVADFAVLTKSPDRSFAFDPVSFLIICILLAIDRPGFVRIGRHFFSYCTQKGRCKIEVISLLGAANLIYRHQGL